MTRGGKGSARASESRIAGLVPELRVNSLSASLAFWRDVCGFTIGFQRQEERFVFIELQGAQVMLCERHGRYETGTMTPPLGQGAMFQIFVDAVEPILSALRESAWPLYEEPRERWYRAGERENGLLQFRVQDPDGYLIVFAQTLGTRQVPE